MKKGRRISEIIFFFFLLEIIPALLILGAGAEADPEGSTGCSKKFFFFDSAFGLGWCWRYCQGSSGKWCYTSKFCTSDEEKCAADTTCPGYGCSGAAKGCVVSCPTPTTTTPARTGEPLGSSGCSKKWFHGYCWRYCKGSSGSWCYTRKGCRGDEESCAYSDTCGGISCEGAAPGCVYKCHDTQCLKFIKHEKGESSFYSLEISSDSRVLSKDPEVRPYITVEDDSKDELRRKKRAHKFTSLDCWADPDVDYGVQQVFERQIRDLERDPSVVQERPRDGNNPIEVVYRRPIQDRNWLGQLHDRLDDNGNVVLRAEVVVAEIHPRHLNPNNYRHFPAWTTEYMINRLDGIRTEDIRFHLVANTLGGPPELYNMVPGHQSVNNNVDTPHDRRRNDWPSVERAMRNHLRQGNGNYVRWYVGLYHDDTETGRPTHFTYMAVLIYGGGNRINIFGSSENRQL